MQFSNIQLIFCIQSWSGQSSNITVNIKQVLSLQSFDHFTLQSTTEPKSWLEVKIIEFIHVHTHDKLSNIWWPLILKKTYIIINTCIYITKSQHFLVHVTYKQLFKIQINLSEFNMHQLYNNICYMYIIFFTKASVYIHVHIKLDLTCYIHVNHVPGCLSSKGSGSSLW